MQHVFQSFWLGPQISPYQLLSMQSFVSHGHRYILYCYDRMPVVPGVELDNRSGATSELPLRLGGGAPVLSAHEVGRRHLLPRRRLHRLPHDRQALPG